MDKKIIAIFICLLTLSSAAELGRITRLSGEVTISRDLEILEPIVASRIYARDNLLLGKDAFVQIELPRSILRIEGPADVQVNDRGRFEKEYGTLTYRRKNNERKSLPVSIGYTLLFPGSGHLYLDDQFKAWPMMGVSTWLLWNIFNNNPEHSQIPQRTSELRQVNQQIYLVYLIVAVMDVWSTTNWKNKQADANSKLIEEL